MSRGFNHTALAIAMVLVVFVALAALQCPELACAGCADDEPTVRHAGAVSQAPAVEVAAGRIGIPASVGVSQPPLRILSAGMEHPALIARLVI